MSLSNDFVRNKNGIKKKMFLRDPLFLTQKQAKFYFKEETPLGKQGASALNIPLWCRNKRWVLFYRFRTNFSVLKETKFFILGPTSVEPSVQKVAHDPSAVSN